MLDTLTRETTDSQSPERELVIADRCDRCGAQAYMQAIKDGFDLLFCGHHGRRFTPALVAKHFVVLDSTHKINEKPTAPDPDQL